MGQKLAVACWIVYSMAQKLDDQTTKVDDRSRQEKWRRK